MASTMKKPLSMLLGAFVLACMGCEPYGGELIRSNKQRLAASAASEAEAREAARGNAELGFDLYHGVRATPGNVFFSPYSVSLALGMTYAGARGETAAEMAGALNFNLPDAQLHPAFNAIDLALASRDDSAKGPFQLNVVNALWTQQGFQFKPEFLDTLAESYGAGMRALDFETSAEESRKIINNWVSYHTNSRIPELLGAGAVDGGTRLVLTNAVYFNAAWQSAFDKANTVNRDFHLLDGSTKSVPMMRRQFSMPYLHADGYQVVELPYSNADLVMTVIVPDAGKFAEVEGQLSTTLLDSLSSHLAKAEVSLGLPRFKTDRELPLTDLLQGLGMNAAFTPGVADFSGMNGAKNLYISDTLHKAWVSVSEEGTEAAAATAVVVRVTAIEPSAELVIDRPFMFVIRDLPTGAILFVGRVVDPT